VDEEGFQKLVERQIEILRRGGAPPSMPSSVTAVVPTPAPSVPAPTMAENQPISVPTDEVNISRSISFLCTIVLHFKIFEKELKYSHFTVESFTVVSETLNDISLA
jgi:hypothetical protein